MLDLLSSSSFVASSAAAAVMVPAATFAGLSPWSLRSVRESYQEHGRAVRRLAAVAAIGEAVHSLQVERGLSVALLSGGPGAPVVEARQNTDRAWSALNQACSVCGEWGEVLTPYFQAVLAVSDALKDLRQGVDDKRIVAKNALAHYCAAISHLISFVERVVSLTLRGATARMGQAYVTLITAKEIAGQERATGNAALTAEAAVRAEKSAYPGASPLLAAHRQLADLIDEQKIYLSLLQDLAPAEVAEHVRTRMGQHHAFDALRQRVLDGDGSVTPAEWFTAATQRINALKDIENRLSAEMHTLGTVRCKAAYRLLHTVRLSTGAVVSSWAIFIGSALYHLG